MSQAEYCVYSDGGCLQNGTQEAHGYASYLLASRTGKRQIVRLNNLPGVTTNNQAEYVALISALVDLRGRIERAGKNPRNYSAAVQTDSQLVVGQVTQGWQVKATNLRSLMDETRTLIQTFGPDGQPGAVRSWPRGPPFLASPPFPKPASAPA